METKNKFIVLHFWGYKDITELNRAIQDESNELFTLYDDVDVQSMVRTDDLRATIIYKVKLGEVDMFPDWET